jgi:O-antigen/teichoic acid export membrane protein
MVGKIRQLTKNPLFTGLFFLSLANIFSNFLNYYYNFYIQSLFPGFTDFGDFMFILTFLTLSQIIPGSVLGTLNIIVTELKVKNEFAKLTLLYIRMLTMFSIVGFVIGLFVFSVSTQISEIFKINNIYYIQLLGLLIFLGTATSPVGSFLYGLLKFKSFSFIILASSFLKIFYTFLLFSLGYGFVSILYAFILSSITIFIFGNLLLITHYDPKYKISNISEITKRLILFSIPLLFILTGSSILNQVDFMILKNKLDPVVSGMYGYLLNFGKIFYFGSIIFCGAMAPQITESFTKKENYFKILFFYLKIVISIVTIGLTALIFFTKEFLDLFVYLTSHIGLKLSSLVMFYEVLDYLPLYSIFLAIYVLINFLTSFLVATSTYKIFISYILAVIVQATLIFIYANDIYTTIYCNIFVSSVLLLYLLYEVYRKHFNFNHSSNL